MASHRGGAAGAIGLTVVLASAGCGLQGPAGTSAADHHGHCSAGAHTLSAPGSRVYPETGNSGYTSLHTDVHLVYDAPPTSSCRARTSTSPAGDAVPDRFQPRLRAPAVNATAGPDMTVQSITVNGQPATFTFKQPTYPGDPNGQDDPDPLAHAASNSNPVSATNPNPPACAPTGTGAALQGVQCPANKLVITPSAPIPAGSDFKVVVNYTGRPGVHVDGDGLAEGWFRNNVPVGDGGFITTEPVGTMAWMPLNNHPTVKPTYDFWTTTNWDAATGTGRTAISNGRLVGFTATTPPDANFPGGSRTWHWKSPEPIANYLVENSVGNYDMTERTGAQRRPLLRRSRPPGSPPRARSPTRRSWTCRRTSRTSRATFNGPFPFNANGVIIGLPDA